MSTRLQWFLDLIDGVSDPGAKIEKQLRGVRTEIRMLDIQAKTARLDKLTDPLKRQRLELQLQRDKLVLSKSALDKTGEGFSRAAQHTDSFTQRLHDLLHIAQIVGGALERVGRSAAEVGRRAAGAISFKETSLIRLGTQFGPKAGGQLFEQLSGLSGRSGAPLAQLVGMAGDMEGFTAPQAMLAATLLDDLAAMQSPEKAAGVASLVEAIQSTGFANERDIRGTRKLGLKHEAIEADLAQRLGVSRSSLRTMLEAGAVPANEATSAIFQNILDQEGGVAGKAGARRGQSFEGQFDRLEARVNATFARLSKSAGVKAFHNAIENVLDLFNPKSDSGKRIDAVLDKLSDTFAKILDPLTGPEGKARMTEFFTSLLEFADKAIPKLAKLAEWTFKLASFALPTAFDGNGNTATEKFTADFVEQEKRLKDLKRAMPLPTAAAMRPIEVTVQVDARGATNEDAEHIGHVSAAAVKDALNDIFREGNMELGVSPPEE